MLSTAGIQAQAAAVLNLARERTAFLSLISLRESRAGTALWTSRAVRFPGNPVPQPEPGSPDTDLSVDRSHPTRPPPRYAQ